MSKLYPSLTLININNYNQSSLTNSFQNQPRKPVWRQAALHTWRVSLPLWVLPAPSTTEKAVIGDSIPYARATIPCGGRSVASFPPLSLLSTSSR
ncbi:hypothetical protein AXF42_Ash003480 [Apostasia shenzhenica]|uniref:Uncharacterized protein n=1 Tax=Apostasia shenzhenica TaxID=1088818 RepID=A0A2I0BGD3_9ASPA|nr:hypothetical protein AXF42_Ash003480 [Apostasia shenzhenica]